MRLRQFHLLCFTTFAFMVGFALPCFSDKASPSAAVSPAIKKYEALVLINKNEKEFGEVANESYRKKLLALKKTEVFELISSSKNWLLNSKDSHERTVLAFLTLRKHKDFSSSMAQSMIAMLDDVRRNTNSPEPLTLSEARLNIFLTAKAGLLSADRIQSEVDFASDPKNDSVERVARLSTLIDAMADVTIKPSPAQLERLLRNDLSTIRSLSVDWFRLSPPAESTDRIHFLTLAFAANPVQVSARARSACEADSAAVVREACGKLKNSVGSP